MKKVILSLSVIFQIFGQNSICQEQPVSWSDDSEQYKLVEDAIKADSPNQYRELLLQIRPHLRQVKKGSGVVLGSTEKKESVLTALHIADSDWVLKNPAPEIDYAIVNQKKGKALEPLSDLEFSTGVQNGEKLIIVGWPIDTNLFSFEGKPAYSVGQVMDQEEIERLPKMFLDYQKEIGVKKPELSPISYDPAIEYLVKAATFEGMSGGGAFNMKGQLVGILIRGTNRGTAGPYYSRILRIGYIESKLKILEDENSK